MKLMTHIVAGYPDMKTSEQIAWGLLEEGADFLEIQIPFSDPIADGPVVANANEVSLSRGASVAECFAVIGRVAARTTKPIFVMTYYNIIYRYGVSAFCAAAREIGVRGIIVPDYPFDEDEGHGLLAHSRANVLDYIHVTSPKTSAERMRVMLAGATGFVYCTARTGMTGAPTSVTNEIIGYLARVRAVTPLPLALGFGLSHKTQFGALRGSADIVVIGTALMRAYANARGKNRVQAARAFVRELGLHSGASDREPKG